jgi:hypothetical protein
LQETEGFNSFGEICQWLQTQLGISAPYKTAHQWVHHRLGAPPKVSRSQSVENTDERLRHIKNLGENLAMLAAFTITVMGLSGAVRFSCEDETRIGLKTISGRKITLRRVKPKGKVQWLFKATYLYSVVEAATGEHFFYEFTHFNTDCFQVFLNLVSYHVGLNAHRIEWKKFPCWIDHA